jgi:hypothetical protein
MVELLAELAESVTAIERAARIADEDGDLKRPTVYREAGSILKLF